jgi:hypothetical protein
MNGGDRYHSCPEITEPLREIRILFVFAPWRSAILLVAGAEHRSKALMARRSGYRLAEERKRHGLTQGPQQRLRGSRPAASRWPC